LASLQELPDGTNLRSGQEASILMNAMHYLFAAYAAIWVILALYLFSIHSREKRLAQEIERLKQALERQ
jgi:CcmD family protein